MQDTWPKEERWIMRLIDRRAWIMWTHSPPDLIKCTCFKEGVITAQINARGEHPDRRIAIQRRRSDAL